MGQPTFVFHYEIRYKGQICVTADDQSAATQFWQSLQLANLITQAGEPSINLLNVSSNDEQCGGIIYDD